MLSPVCAASPPACGHVLVGTGEESADPAIFSLIPSSTTGRGGERSDKDEFARWRRRSPVAGARRRRTDGEIDKGVELGHRRVEEEEDR
jgi:hypothetical protein